MRPQVQHAQTFNIQLRDAQDSMFSDVLQVLLGLLEIWLKNFQTCCVIPICGQIPGLHVPRVVAPRQVVHPCLSPNLRVQKARIVQGGIEGLELYKMTRPFLKAIQNVWTGREGRRVMSMCKSVFALQEL